MRRSEVLALVVFLSLAALFALAPRARADHGSVPWSVPSPVLIDTTQDQYPSLAYNGSHGLYAVVDAYNAPAGTTNLSFVAERDTGPYGGPAYLYASRPNDQVAGVGTVSALQRTSIAVDAAGRVYVAWVRSPSFTGGHSEDIDVSVSTDQGRTWPTLSLAVAANDAGDDNNPVIRAAPDGRMWVAYVQTWVTTNVTFAVSSDHGATFTGFRNATVIPTGLFLVGYDFQIDSQGRLHLLYAQCNGAFICSVFYEWSDDGVTWSAPFALLVGDQPGGPLFGFDPTLAIQGSTLHVVWFDSRETPSGSSSLRYVRSFDRGATWGSPVPITLGLTTVTDAASRIAISGSQVMVVWGSNSTGMGWTVSADGGTTWYPEGFTTLAPGIGQPALAVDENGTFHVVVGYNSGGTNLDLYEMSWDGPPDAPTLLTTTSPAAHSLALSWAPPPQGDVVAYDLWTSPDGSTYSLAATVRAPATSWTDTGLANGTYWFKVTAVDATNHMSHDSVPVAGTVGPSLQDRMSALQDQINTLQQELNAANADLSAIQGQIDGLRSQLGAIQGNTTALQEELNLLQNQVDQMRAAQNLTTLLIVLVVVVLAVQTFLLVRLGRRPKRPAAAPPGKEFPEDEL